MVTVVCCGAATLDVIFRVEALPAGPGKLLPLAVTSNNAAIRRLGARWRRLHMLVYPIILGGALHYAMAVKTITFEPFLYLTLAILLVAYRLLRPTMLARRKRRLATQRCTK